METQQDRLLDLLSQPDTRFVIPAYQRSYAWGQRQCEELWDDVQRAARDGQRHFIGTVLYSRKEDDAEGNAQMAVIDGQQRLTTATLALIALRDWAHEHHLQLDGQDAAAATWPYLRAGASGDAEAPAKLTLSRHDRATLAAAATGKALPGKPSPRIMDNLRFFRSRMEAEGFDANAFWRGLHELSVISAQADEGDHAQHIFDSLNSKGVPLTTADLVRNYLLLAEGHDEQTRLYNEYWAPIEDMFQPDPGSKRLANGIQGWLAVRFRQARAHGEGEVYPVFKRYMEDEFTGSIDDLLGELYRFCLVWAENYRYHGIKKFKSGTRWATQGPGTLVGDRTPKAADDERYAERVRQGNAAADASL